MGALLLLAVLLYVALIVLSIALIVVPAFLALAFVAYTGWWLMKGRPRLALLEPTTRTRLRRLWVLGPLSIGWLGLVYIG